MDIDKSEWYRDDQIVKIYEALSIIRKESIYSKESDSVSAKVLQTYIRTIDPYGDYFSKKEYQAYQQLQDPDYAGVGLLLTRKRGSTDILCIPARESIIQAGISQYDRLISIDGKQVQGINLYILGNLIRGKIGTSVTLKLQKTSGKYYTVTLPRTKQHYRSIRHASVQNLPMLRIIHFNEETPEELSNALRRWPSDMPIIIDLRGNSGGDFDAAVKSAALLLSDGKLIAMIRSRSHINKFQSSTPDITNGQQVILLQDHYTASAAEVFIAALTQNGRAHSIGTRSYGKGVAQKFYVLSGGDALLLTYGKIITPNQKSYDQKGLVPDYPLSYLAHIMPTKRINKAKDINIPNDHSGREQKKQILSPKNSLPVPSDNPLLF